MLTNDVKSGLIVCQQGSTLQCYQPALANILNITRIPLERYVITPFAAANGTITPGTPQTVIAGSNLTFNAIANTNYNVDQWVIDADVAQKGGATFTLSNIIANHTGEVTFTQNGTIYAGTANGHIYFSTDNGSAWSTMTVPVYANSTAPTLNPEVAQYVSEISGLSNIPESHSNLESAKSNKNKNYHDLNFIWHNFAPNATPTDISLQGFSGANLQKTYGLANIPTINGVHLDGAGQTFIVVDKCGTNGPSSIISDANQYFNANGITPYNTAGPGKNFAIINSDGSPFTTCPSF